MSRHKQVTECRRGGPVSKLCACEHCTIAVCATCGAYEGSLTTDCPGSQVSFDRQQEVYETNLDYTDDRGWHQGELTQRRSPRFEEPAPPAAAPSSADDHVPRLHRGAPGFTQITGCWCGWRTPPDAKDSDTAFAAHVALARAAPTIDWAATARATALQQELAKKAIAWVVADRTCEDFSALLTSAQDELTRLKDELDAGMPTSAIGLVRAEHQPSEHERALLGKLEQLKVGFHLADDRAQTCDDEFRQSARRLVDELEQSPPTSRPGTTEPFLP